MKLSELFDITDEHFTYYPSLIKTFDINITACVLLCSIGWKTLPESNGWKVLNIKEIRQHTGLTIKEEASARAQLLEKGLIESVYDRQSHKGNRSTTKPVH